MKLENAIDRLTSNEEAIARMVRDIKRNPNVCVFGSCTATDFGTSRDVEEAIRSMLKAAVPGGE